VGARSPSILRNPLQLQSATYKSDGNSFHPGMSYCSNDLPFQVQPSQQSGAFQPNEYTQVEKYDTPTQIENIRNNISTFRSTNQAINMENRTYKVRPEPIQLAGSSVRVVKTTDSKNLIGGREKCPSLTTKDVAINNHPKGILRSVTPRRMIIHVQHQEPHTMTPQKTDVTSPKVTSLIYSASKSRRSRQRGLRADSTRSMTSTASSIAFDTIFVEVGDNRNNNTNTGSGASFLSLMSLSIGDVLSSPHKTDPKRRAPFFDSSAKIGTVHSSDTISTPSTVRSVTRVPLKRNGSDIVYFDKCVYDMSVNTLSVGDSDMDGMTNSHNGRSLIQVFDDNSISTSSGAVFVDIVQSSDTTSTPAAAAAISVIRVPVRRSHSDVVYSDNSICEMSINTLSLDEPDMNGVDGLPHEESYFRVFDDHSTSSDS
jgi:hypothetical protein